MSLSLVKPQHTELKPRIVVFGVGGAGGNAVNNMITAGLDGVDFVVANTDAQALTMSKAQRLIQMGTQVTQGLGAGSQPDVGSAAAQEVIDEIRDHLNGANMVFVTAGMGGGTGTGAAPVIAAAAREQGILTIGVVGLIVGFVYYEKKKAASATTTTASTGVTGGSGSGPALGTGQNPLDQCLDIGIGNMGVGRHRYRSPGALPACLDLGDQFRLGIGLSLVARLDLVVARADDLAVHAMAGHAAALGCQIECLRCGRLLRRTGREPRDPPGGRRQSRRGRRGQLLAPG